MAQASEVRLRFFLDQIPILSSARRYAREWIFPGGTADNRIYYSPHVHFVPEIDETSQMLLFDAQTSGGLLLAVPPEKLSDLLLQAKALEQPMWVVGEVLAGEPFVEVF
jgi:selenide,water dikinase